MKSVSLIVLTFVLSGFLFAQMPERPRMRDLGIEIGIFKPGPLNAITDVRNVRVGHVTLLRGDSVRTGVTAILPHNQNLFQRKVSASIFVGNGFGKLLGVTQRYGRIK